MGGRSGLERTERGPGRAGWDHGEVGQGGGRGQGGQEEGRCMVRGLGMMPLPFGRKIRAVREG